MSKYSLKINAILKLFPCFFFSFFQYAVHAFEILKSLQLCKKKFVVAVVVLSCMFTLSPKK